MARKPASSQHDNTNLTEEVIVSTETETVETPIEDVVTEAPEAMDRNQFTRQRG